MLRRLTTLLGLAILTGTGAAGAAGMLKTSAANAAAALNKTADKLYMFGQVASVGEGIKNRDALAVIEGGAGLAARRVRDPNRKDALDMVSAGAWVASAAKSGNLEDILRSAQNFRDVTDGVREGRAERAEAAAAAQQIPLLNSRPLELQRVGLRGAGIDAADPPDDAGLEEEPLGEAGLAGIDMRQDAQVEKTRSHATVPSRGGIHREGWTRSPGPGEWTSLSRERGTR